jgi:ornithine cyclodeaminase/alanine dehydrogenase-like protein (mu-crystallin family)
MTEADVRAELAEVLVGSAPGRSSSEEIVIFDSTGTALLDVAASSAIYERAEAAGSKRWLCM